ncbi:hypothetical protein QYE76_057374 [Lolium multiflorum]|uniref:CCHC-type domain-containing protein n=1 Tax=Lolium multiflorum TaxID=4521 RepID=A0AAD8T4B2_LOLMU|nr:hypothetical protein QYE76_057374 [Lolium multiflorum]
MSASDNKIVNQENKNSADIITWREYEALRNEMRREFRTNDDELKSTVDEIKQTLDATNVTVTGLSDQMTDIQRNIADMRLAIENLTVLQQQQQEDDEDPELEDDAHNARGAPRGHRPRGWVPLGRNGRGQDEEDGLGKPKFSIPKFEGGADVEEYLTWELKIEKLWSLHPHYSEDRKIKLASSEFDGYALRWWDSLVRNRDEDGAQPIRTWRAMKEAMTSRFVPTNYMRNIFDKLTLLRQGVKTVDEYYMEMEMLMQRGRVRESLEMTMQRFLNGLKYDVKGIVRHYTYTNMNQLLHHAREAESQLAEEAKVKGRATGAGRFTPRAPSTAPAPSTRSAPYSTPPSKPVSNVSNAKKSESAASTSGSGASTTRNRDMLCHTCGGKGHFKRDCPNRKVMFINEDNEYETGDDVDPNAPDNDDYDTDGEDAYPSDARTIVVSQRALNVLPSASTQRCNLFQTKALVGPDKACKVIIDGGSCRNLASKELCTKLKLKYLPHPHPYYIQWLSDNGEMKVNHMVRVEFAIGPYKDCIDFDVVPMTEFGDVFPEEVPAGLPPLRGSFQGSREENDILRSRGVKALSLGMPPWFIPAYFKKTQASKLGDAQGIPFFIDNIIRNPSKEIFSELDETFAQGPIFARSFQKTEDLTKWGHEAARRVAGAAQALAAPTCPLGPRVALALTFRLLKASVAKPPSRATIRKTLQRRRRESHLGGFGDRLRHPAGEGIHLPRTLHRHDRLRSDE